MRSVLALVVMCGVAQADRISPHVRPFQGRIIGLQYVSDGKAEVTELTVAYKHYRWKLDTAHWRASFVVDGNVLDCAPLRIVRVDMRTVRVWYRPAHPDAKPAAEYVRFEPNEQRDQIERDPESSEDPPELPPSSSKGDPCAAAWTVSSDEAHAQAIDAPVIDVRVADGKLALSIEVPGTAPVTRHWTGIFTVNGAPLGDVRFVLDKVGKGLATALLPLPAVYSDHVRLLPPP